MRYMHTSWQLTDLTVKLHSMSEPLGTYRYTAARVSRASGHIHLATRKRGPKWYLRYRLPGGRQVVKCLGPAWTEKGRPPAGYFTKRTAQAALREILVDAERGLLPDGRHTGITFQHAADDWLAWAEHERKLRPSTLTDYRTAARVLCAEFGAVPVEELTPHMVDGYRRGLVADGRLSPRSINKRLVRGFSICARAQRRHGLATNPFALVERQREERGGDLRILSPVEIESLARAATCESDSVLYLTAAYSGLRQGELLALRWADIDFSSPCIFVRRALSEKTVVLPKSGRVRSVPMMDRLVVVLDALSRRAQFTEPDDLVFPSALGDHQSRFAVYERFQNALATAGLAAMRFHDLRHCFASLALRRLPLTSVQRFLGHADIQTTARYLHYLPQADEAAQLTVALSRDNAPRPADPPPLRAGTNV